jgi:hypothetical protein
MVQPLSDVTVVRPWHWGIAMVVDPECEAPDVRPEQVVTVDESGLASCPLRSERQRGGGPLQRVVGLLSTT